MHFQCLNMQCVNSLEDVIHDLLPLNTDTLYICTACVCIPFIFMCIANIRYQAQLEDLQQQVERQNAKLSMKDKESGDLKKR